MKTQIVYALIASENDRFIEEIWVSVFSLRLYEKEREVRVCCDAPTAERLKLFPKLMELLTDVIVIPTPESYDAKHRSRHVKTLTREYIKGPFLFIDTDTVICGALDYIDNLECDMAGVPEGNTSFKQFLFRANVLSRIRDTFDIDASNHPHWINTGVIYVADNDFTHEFYRHWHENWEWSSKNKGMSQDMPGFLKAEMDMGYVMDELPGYYNAQPFMSVQYYGEAKIIHYVHSFFPKDQSFCPFFDKSIYEKIHREGEITPEIADIILHAKSNISSPSIIVGEKTVNFMTSSVEPIFETIYAEGGAASWLMIKLAGWLEKLHRYTRKK